MPEDTLRSYIASQRALQIPDHSIRSALGASGWSTADIDAALNGSSDTTPPSSAPIPVPGAIRVVSVLLGLLSLGEFGTGFALLITMFTMNTVLSKNGAAPPYSFIPYVYGLLMKAVSAIGSGIVYAYLAMRVGYMDKKAITLIIVSVIILLVIETITGSFAAIQLRALMQQVTTHSGGSL